MYAEMPFATRASHGTICPDSMQLVNGTRLGPYEIVAPLGSGGMGDVYKARDTRLDRIVAIKEAFSELFSVPTVGTGRGYSVAGNGQRFQIPTPAGQTPVAPITVTTNWAPAR
jgi:serine/threonine protein kinase